MPQTEPPPPGSDEALEQGCECPVLDNAHGEGWMLAPGVYWITASCPIHGTNQEAGDGK